MADRDPLFDLPDLAAYAEDHTSPPPPEQIRARGAQRRRRRHVGAVAATVAAVLIGGGAVFSQTGMLGDRSVDPAPQPSVTAVPSIPGVDQELSAANLPTSFDLELNYPKDWVVGVTVTAFGAQLERALPTLLDGELADYHAYAFATVRMAGAAFEILATHVEWLFGPEAAGPAAEDLGAIVEGAKLLSFKLARRRAFDPSERVEALAGRWTDAMGRLDALAG